MTYEKSKLQNISTPAQDLISSGCVSHCPPDGEGCNAWTYKTTLTLISAGCEDDEIHEIVQELSTRDEKNRLKEETTRSIERGREYLSLSEDDRKKFSRPKRPLVDFDYDCLQDQVKGVGDPHKILEDATDECHNPKEYLNSVFAHGEKVCVLRGTRKKKDLFFHTRVQGRIPGSIFEDMLSGPEGVFFLSNPISGKQVDGSWRSKDCLTSFRHLVLECDHSEKDYPGITDNWLKYLITLSLPIKSIITSGGKSVHALVDIGTETEKDFDLSLNQIYEPLVMSGADPNSLTSVRLTRLPFSFRGKNTQDLLYVKSNPKGDSIEEAECQ